MEPLAGIEPASEPYKGSILAIELKRLYFKPWLSFAG